MPTQHGFEAQSPMQLLNANGDNQPSNNLPPLITWADLAEVMPPITWDWYLWLPRGFLTILAGAPGSGKSIFALDAICRSFITGSDWPDGQPNTGRTGKVLWLEAEGANALNLDRARTFGLPMDSIIAISIDPFATVSIVNEAHKTTIEEIAMDPDIVCIILDSLSGGHGADENNSQAMIPILRWLAGLAAKTNKPVIATHHLNKREIAPGQDITLNQLRGSTAIGQFARIVCGISQPSVGGDKTLRKMYIVKSNLDRFPEPIGLTITEAGVVPTPLPRTPVKRNKQKMAGDFLPGLFKDGPLPATEVELACNENGISYNAAERVKDSLGITSEKQGDVWIWSMAQDN